MLNSFLPQTLCSVLKNINEKDVYEFRFRVSQPILVNYKGTLNFLSKDGLTLKKQDAIFCNKQMIENILFKVTSASLYSFSEELKQGFITTTHGIRVGISGEVVSEGKKIITIKNISSLNVRIPHEVIGCCLKAFPYLCKNNILQNTLIISPPGAGKTTFLRDLALQVFKSFPNYNVLILDERYEIASCVNGAPELQVGQADVISGAKKQFGFQNGIRSMSPQIIFTDEIATKYDIGSILYASSCGVQVIATVHAKNLGDLKKKPHFSHVLSKNVFKRFVVLSNRLGVGTLEGVFDENFQNLVKE